MVKSKDMQLCMENLKMKRKGTKIVFDLPEPGFEPQIFSKFPALDLNLRVMSSNLGNLLKEIGLYVAQKSLFFLQKDDITIRFRIFPDVAQKQFVYIFLQSLYEKFMGPSI